MISIPHCSHIKGVKGKRELSAPRPHTKIYEAALSRPARHLRSQTLSSHTHLLFTTSQSTILENLKLRYYKDEFMTAVGPILVVINPYKFHASKYGTDVIHKYHEDSSLAIDSPHVYDLTERAFRNLGAERTTQAILISGESGAGKTETTKTCLRYLSEVAGADSDISGGDIDARILSANPVLEAFGNAKTLRNDNSSRFGKWLEVHFLHDKLSICGCSTVSYLLEKTRVVGCGPGERSYHIFYQLLASSDIELKSETLRIPDADSVSWKDYRTLTPFGESWAGGKSLDKRQLAQDAREFDITTDALGHLGFGAKTQDEIFRVLAGILSLGNVVFKGDSQGYAIVDNANKGVKKSLDHAALCFGVDVSQLERALCVQTLQIAGETTDRRLLPASACENRDALGKALYGRLFDFLITRFNEEMSPSTTHRSADTLVIGILDIFGFEIFARNSFEQLCINFANEKLQQNFNSAVFKEEMQACKEEGISGVQLRFTDNQDVLDLIEARGRRGSKIPMGILPMLDEEGRIVGGSDEGYLNKIRRTHASNRRLLFKSPHKSERTEVNEFWVHHYADYVKYDVQGFVDKNRDILLPGLQDLMLGGSRRFIASKLFSDVDVTKKKAPSATRKQKTQGGLFTGQLKSLMNILESSTPHFIRCIKPNNTKESRLFSAGMCHRQLACSGVYEAVRIRKQGFPHRFVHREFIRRYWTLAPAVVHGFDYTTSRTDNTSDVEKARGVSEAIIRHIEERVPGFAKQDTESMGCLIGRSKIFIPETHFSWLEKYRDVIRKRAIYDLQRVSRGFTARAFCRSLTKSRRLLRAAIAAGDVSGAQQILQRVKKRTGKRIGLQGETRQVNELVEQHRMRQRLLEIIDTAFDGAQTQGADGKLKPSTLWQNRGNLRTAHSKLTDPEKGLTAGGTRELTGSDSILLKKAEDAINIVAEMEQARSALVVAMEQPTVASLSRAIARATDMEHVRGTFCSDEINAARQVLNDAAATQVQSRGKSPRAPRPAPPLPPPSPSFGQSQGVSSQGASAAMVAATSKQGISLEVYHAQSDALNAIGLMSGSLQSTWGRMSTQAKLRKLLLLEGLCESLRSSIFEEEEYKQWAIDRLGKLTEHTLHMGLLSININHRLNVLLTNNCLCLCPVYPFIAPAPYCEQF